MTNAQNAIAANIEALAGLLAEASKAADEARDAARSGHINLAIGTLLTVERAMADIPAIAAAALALHRLGR